MIDKIEIIIPATLRMLSFLFSMFFLLLIQCLPRHAEKGLKQLYHKEIYKSDKNPPRLTSPLV